MSCLPSPGTGSSWEGHSCKGYHGLGIQKIKDGVDRLSNHGFGKKALTVALKMSRKFPGGLGVMIQHYLCYGQVRSLVWELRFHVRLLHACCGQKRKKERKIFMFFGVPNVAQRIKNLTLSEDASSIPDLTQWFKHLALQKPWCRLHMQLRSSVAVAVA